MNYDSICEHIAHGKSLVAWCKENGVGYSTVMTHLRENEEFQKNYTRAREDAADFHADEVIEIADTETDSAKARVRVDARKWVAAKMKPKKYGEKITQEHTGADGGPIEHKDVSQLDKDILAQHIPGYKK